MLARWNDWPLRLRLTTLYVGLLLVILAALGSFLYVDTRDYIFSTTALRLQAIATTAIGHLTQPRLPGPPFSQPMPDARGEVTSTMTLNSPPFEVVGESLARDLTWQDTTAVVFDQTGGLIADGRQTAGEPAIPTPDPGDIARTFAGDSVTYVTTISSQDTLAVLIPVHYPHPDSAVSGIIQMSVPLDVADQVLQRQRIAIVGGVLLALLIAAAGGLWLTQTALTPLRLMIAVCRRIAAGDLSQRINLPQRKDETGQLASAFDDMVARLDDAFATQRQFVADASHELRTPLTAVGGSLDVLLMAPEGDPETTRRVLHGMRREVQRLTRLVTDLLTLTRLDARRPLNLQVVDLSALAREVVEGMKPLAQNRRIAVETSGDTRNCGDADQLKQVFYNLLDNAIHSTDPENGTVSLHIEGLEHAVRVAVSDNGAGIPEESQPRIFERFYRVDKARARGSGGSGLGLAIVKAIVERHGGSMEAPESRIGQGTTIRFDLPRERGCA